MAKVSVVVPVYNVEKYLEQCLDSIVNQTLEDIEIICVNDGSTDSSYDILKRYEKMDSRIKVISKEDTGYGHTINIGVEAASGKYIAIIDSDDFAETNMMEKMYEAAELYQVDAVKCNYYQYYNGENTYVENLKGLPYNEAFCPIENLDIFMVDATTHFVWNRKLFTEQKLRLNETPGASFQDVSFQFQIFFYAEKVALLKEALIHYRTDNENSSVNNTKKIFCICDEFEYIDSIINNSKADMKILYPYLAQNKYRTYKWNYFRISEEYQYAFLVKWCDTLHKDYAMDILKEELFSTEEWDEINTIIKNRDQFFDITAKYSYLKGLTEQIINNIIYIEALKKYIKESKDIIIYGCGSVGEKIAASVVDQINLTIHCFAVTDADCQKEKTKNGIPIVSVTNLKERYPAETLIVLTVSDKYTRSVLKMIHEQGYNKIIIIEDKIKNLI